MVPVPCSFRLDPGVAGEGGAIPTNRSCHCRSLKSMPNENVARAGKVAVAASGSSINLEIV